MARSSSPDSSPDLFNSTSNLLSFLDLNDRRSNMDQMDIDPITIPDTPDRLSTQKINSGRRNFEEIESSSGGGSSGISNLLDKGGCVRVRDHRRLNVENPKHRRLFSRPRGDIGVHDKSRENSHPVVSLADSPSVSLNSRLFRRMMSGKGSSEPHFSENITPSNDRAKLDGGTSSIAELLAADGKTLGKNKEKVIDLMSSPVSASRNLRKKTSLQDDRSYVDEGLCSSSSMGVDRGKGIYIPSDGKHNTEPVMSRSLHSPTLPRKSGQRRLVRNGCISPHNVAKAKLIAESHVKSHEDGRQVDTGVVPGERDTDRVKGKGVMEESSARKSSLNPTVEANRTEGSFEAFDAMGGWRSTRNHSSNTSSFLSDSAGHLSRTISGVGHSHEINDAASFNPGPTPFLAQASSNIRSEMDRESGLRYGATKRVRRQRKRGSACSDGGESLIFDDLEILGPSEEPSNARSTRIRSNRHCGSLHPVIEIEDVSPVQSGGLRNMTQMDNDDSDVRARQVEADEMLARELQEEFYHELPGVGGGEIDASIAWGLQQEEDVERAASLRRQRVHPRDASMSHLYRQQQTQALQNSSVRYTNRAIRARSRAPTSARGAQFRDRRIGSSPTISARGRHMHFPQNMDVEMRIHILEALEAAAAGISEDVTRASTLFHAQRDFNENDYEMLLALDENNHQHVGATSNQINGLPQSTVQTDNFAEACAVCLETPTIGDTIRHLPCLHKFHKDCIDPWLRRKTSCPICKCSIT
ncbi:hypothetical protein IFM89_000215 [Coptis chinensis]|uniref:RING-type domain-containing protein n=1 Tax=Coptis chinensis TaxID=261450 RepID=A0A835I962_9MAGN|nr:hypothetical protein IFM89_000215 [Coptis chinensis]